MDTIAAYLIFLNLVGFLIMGEDKRRAKMHRWRISERMSFYYVVRYGTVRVVVVVVPTGSNERTTYVRVS